MWDERGLDGIATLYRDGEVFDFTGVSEVSPGNFEFDKPLSGLRAGDVVEARLGHKTDENEGGAHVG